MIQPDAKCVVNGPKVNEVINALNQLLNIDITIGDVNEPQVQYSYDGVQIVLPKGGAFTNEELDVVDSNNTASTRWFATSTTQGMTPVNTNTSPVNKQNTSTPTGRDNINGGAGTSGALRDEMPLTPNQPNNQGGGVNPPGIDGGGGGGAAGGGGGGGGAAGGGGGGGGAAGGGGGAAGGGGGAAGGGALKDGGTTTRETSHVLPDGTPVTTQEQIASGEWLPSKNGTLDLPALADMVEKGQASQWQQTFFQDASKKHIEERKEALEKLRAKRIRALMEQRNRIARQIAKAKADGHTSMGRLPVALRAKYRDLSLAISKARNTKL